jgi:hypothetical protein
VDTLTNTRLHLYAAPSGRDTWSEAFPQPTLTSADGPFATLGAARDRIRHLRASSAGRDPIEVVILDGRYQLGEPLRFGPEDSGVSYVAAAGAQPVID